MFFPIFELDSNSFPLSIMINSIFSSFMNTSFSLGSLDESYEGIMHMFILYFAIKELEILYC